MCSQGQASTPSTKPSQIPSSLTESITRSRFQREPSKHSQLRLLPNCNPTSTQTNSYKNTMCLALVQNVVTNTKLTRELFNRFWRHNAHGAGVGYWRPNGEPVLKQEMTQDRAWKNYEESFDELNELCKGGYKWPHMLVHFRISTQGSRSPNNTH